MKVWNTEVVQNKIFPNNLKVADITPIFKKVILPWKRIIDL